MKYRWGLSSFLFLLLVTGCATPPPRCDNISEDCSSWPGACRSLPKACAEVPAGADHVLVEILSSPTHAAIYLDGKFIGTSPLLHPLWYSSKTRFLRLTAEPLFPGQARQEQLIKIPPLPSRIQFFMNSAPTGMTKGELIQ